MPLPNTPNDPVSREDLATVWQAGTQADLLRLLDRKDQRDRMNQLRTQAVMDAQASQVTGKEISTPGGNGGNEAMDIRLNSPNVMNPQPIIVNPPPAPPPLNPTPSPWSQVAMFCGFLNSCLLLLFVLFWWLSQIAVKPPTPATPPTPANGTHLNIDVTDPPRE